MAEPGVDRLAILRSRLGAPRGSLIQAIDHLIDLGLIRRSPGYGHPLRPEYLVNPRWQPVVAAAAKLAATAGRRDPELLYRKWSLPVLVSLHAGDRRFGEICAVLPAATDRAISIALRELVDAHLIRRRVNDSAPPAAEYSLHPSACTVARRTADLAATLCK